MKLKKKYNLASFILKNDSRRKVQEWLLVTVPSSLSLVTNLRLVVYFVLGAGDPKGVLCTLDKPSITELCLQFHGWCWHCAGTPALLQVLPNVSPLPQQPTHVRKWGWCLTVSSSFSRKVRSVASPGRRHSSSCKAEHKVINIEDTIQEARGTGERGRA